MYDADVLLLSAVPTSIQNRKIKTAFKDDYGIHRHGTNRAHVRAVHFDGSQRVLKPPKAMKQTVGCAKHQAALSDCRADIPGNSTYSTTRAQAMKSALACHNATKGLRKAESVKRKQSFRNVSESKHTSLHRSNKRSRGLVAQHILRLESFLPPDWM